MLSHGCFQMGRCADAALNERHERRSIRKRSPVTVIAMTLADLEEKREHAIRRIGNRHLLQNSWRRETQWVGRWYTRIGPRACSFGALGSRPSVLSRLAIHVKAGSCGM